MIRAPTRTGHKTYMQPREWTLSPPMTAINAVAPPGGCNVRVKCMAAMANETANEPAMMGISPANMKTVTPTTAETTWPPTRFRGCENSAKGAPYMRTAEAPKEPIRNRLSTDTSSRCRPSIATRCIPKNAPTHDHMIWLTGFLGGHLPVAFIRRK